MVAFSTPTKTLGTVVLVERDLTTLDIMRQMLEQFGKYRVLVAHDAAGAQSALNSHGTVDVLIADVGAFRDGSICGVCHRAIELRPGIAVLLTAEMIDWRPSGLPARSEFLIRQFGIDALLAGVRVAVALADNAEAAGGPRAGGTVDEAFGNR